MYHMFLIHVPVGEHYTVCSVFISLNPNVPAWRNNKLVPRCTSNFHQEFANAASCMLRKYNVSMWWPSTNCCSTACNGSLYHLPGIMIMTFPWPSNCAGGLQIPTQVELLASVLIKLPLWHAGCSMSCVAALPSSPMHLSLPSWRFCLC